MTAIPARARDANPWRSTPVRVLKVLFLIGLLIFIPPLIDNPYYEIISAMLGVAAIFDHDRMRPDQRYAGFLAVSLYPPSLFR